MSDLWPTTGGCAACKRSTSCDPCKAALGIPDEDPWLNDRPPINDDDPPEVRELIEAGLGGSRRG